MEPDPRFLVALRTLARRVRSADPSLHKLAAFKTPTDAELVQLRRSILALCQEADSSARELLDDLLPQLESTPLEDLAVLVSAEIRSELRVLDQLDPDDSTTWQLGILAVQVLSKILKAATAIENAYCEETGCESLISHIAEVETAIEIRTAYSKLWRRIDSTPVADDGQVEKRLRTAGTAIARLSGLPIFLDMRALDRRLLLELQRRVRDWLVGGGSAEDGRHLWQDVVAFAELLRMINHRSELMIHDAQILPRLLDAVADLDLAETAMIEDGPLLDLARTLRGREDRLDDLLATPGPVRTRELFEALGHLHGGVSLVGRHSLARIA